MLFGRSGLGFLIASHLLYSTSKGTYVSDGVVQVRAPGTTLPCYAELQVFLGLACPSRIDVAVR